MLLLTGAIQNGTISSASGDENPDLFFALKGGLNRFAVVTSAVYRTHPQPDEVYVRPSHLLARC